MKTISKYLMLMAAILLTTAGCPSGESFPLANVSGTVTHNGEPMPGVMVTFYPRGSADNPNSGPYSEGVTDASGKYSLTTRYGNPGAVVGTHRVEFSYDDIDEEAMDAGDEAAAEAADEGGEVDSATVSEAEEMKKKMASRKPIPKNYGEESEVEFTVPAEGTSSADFDLAK